MSSTGYAAVVEHLRTLTPELAPAGPGVPPRKFDLAHMRVLMAALGSPQTTFASVLIAGTNGKGSTAATLASILTSAGLRTGLYTSPHLVRVNERMQVSVPVTPSEYSSAPIQQTLGPAELQVIPDDDFARLYVHVDEVGNQLVGQQQLPHHPSFFERLTAVALLWFRERMVEVAVLEVGLGGRLDATNVVEPVISILTDIALDHQEYLGTTLAAITREKAGILRPRGTLITLPQHPEVNQTLGEIAGEMPKLRAVSAADLIPPASRHPSKDAIEQEKSSTPLAGNRYSINFDGRTLQIDSPLAGQHQQRNIALAIAAAAEFCVTKGYKPTDAAIEEGVRRTHWPGRLETIRVRGRTMLLDVAHNPAGAWTLRAAIAQLPENIPRTLLFSCLRDKDLGEMAQILFPLFDSASTDAARQHDHIVFAPISSPRAAHVDQLLAEAHRLAVPAHAAPHMQAAVAQALEITPEGGYVIVSGSVYLVGEVHTLLGDLR